MHLHIRGPAAMPVFAGYKCYIRVYGWKNYIHPKTAGRANPVVHAPARSLS